MKIAMIGHKRVPSREGGVEVVVTELSTHMAAMGQDVVCYNRWEPSVQKDMPKKDEYQGVQLRRVRTFERASLNAIVYSFFATLRAIFSRRYDVIHIHAEGPASMAVLTHLFRVPTVVTIHGLNWQCAKWGGFATRFLRFGEKMAARYADDLIVLSRGNAQYFRDTYGRDSRLIPNGITVRPPAPPREIAERWGLKKDGYVLFLARITPEKGLHHLLDAYQTLNTRMPLVLAGPLTPQTDYIVKVCEQAAKDDRVLTTGFVSGTTFEELMSNAAVYVLPSDVEGMSISLLEALSYGRRCLVSDIPENRDVAGSYARYFEKGNAQSLAGALGAMLCEPDDPQAAEKRMQYVRDTFDWDAVTQSTIDVYQSAIEKRAGKGR